MKEDVHPPVVVLFDVEEAARQLRMSRASLYRLVKQGKVPHRKIKGVGVHFTAGDLETIVAEAHRPAVA